MKHLWTILLLAFNAFSIVTFYKVGFLLFAANLHLFIAATVVLVAIPAQIGYLGALLFKSVITSLCDSLSENKDECNILRDKMIEFGWFEKDKYQVDEFVERWEIKKSKEEIDEDA